MIGQLFRGTLYGLLLSVMFLYGCAGTPAKKELSNYVKAFEEEVGVDTSGVSIYFKNLGSEVAGRCILGVKIIQLDFDYYVNLSFIERKALLFHELAHCSCGIIVHEERGSGICAKSLMAPSMESAWCYTRNWANLVKDLRDKCK